MSGSGSAGAGVSTVRQYDAELDMVFIIPEPSSVVLLLAGAAVVRRRFNM